MRISTVTAGSQERRFQRGNCFDGMSISFGNWTVQMHGCVLQCWLFLCGGVVELRRGSESCQCLLLPRLAPWDISIFYFLRIFIFNDPSVPYGKMIHECSERVLSVMSSAFVTGFPNIHTAGFRQKRSRIEGATQSFFVGPPSISVRTTGIAQGVITKFTGWYHRTILIVVDQMISYWINEGIRTSLWLTLARSFII